MNEIIVLALVFIIGSALIIWASFNLINSAEKIFNKIKLIKQEAEDAETIPELQTAYDNLVKVSKECFHKSFTARLYEVKGIIETKIKILNKNNKQINHA